MFGWGREHKHWTTCALITSDGCDSPAAARRAPNGVEWLARWSHVPGPPGREPIPPDFETHGAVSPTCG